MLQEELLSQPEDNKPKPSPLISLEKDLKFYNDAIKEVSQEIMNEGLSQYPIFIAHQHEVKIGELILDRNELGTQWHIHASTLEEFVGKGIVQAERKESFLKSYKPASTHMCLFVIVPEGANFVFFPYFVEG